MSKLSTKKEQDINKILTNADALIVLTGAGMGVDSGLSVFRGTEGLWEKFPEAKSLGLKFEDLANPSKYLLYPEVTIPFYLERFRNYKQSEPHDGYYDLINYSLNLKKGMFAVTSNVDGYFQRSYLDEDRIYEIHGSINKWQCSNINCCRAQGVNGLIELSLDCLNLGQEKIELTEDLKTKLSCKKCGGFIRPNLLMFYDVDWYSKIYKQQSYLFENFKSKLYNSNVAIIEIGAGETIRSIKNTSEHLAESLRTKVIRINPEISMEEKMNQNLICLDSSGLEGISQILKTIK